MLGEDEGPLPSEEDLKKEKDTASHRIRIIRMAHSRRIQECARKLVDAAMNLDTDTIEDMARLIVRDAEVRKDLDVWARYLRVSYGVYQRDMKRMFADPEPIEAELMDPGENDRKQDEIV